MLELDRVDYRDLMGELDADEQALLVSGKNFYEITFKNHGGLVMPLIVEFQFEDGTADPATNNDGVWLDEEGVRDVSRLLYLV